jgi:hypothetical protein
VWTITEDNRTIENPEVLLLRSVTGVTVHGQNRTEAVTKELLIRRISECRNESFKILNV